MVVAMLGRPPDQSGLGGGLRQKTDDELEYPPGLIRAVCKIAVVAGANRENAYPVKGHADHDIGGRHASEERAQRSDVHTKEAQHRANAGGRKFLVVRQFSHESLRLSVLAGFCFERSCHTPKWACHDLRGKFGAPIRATRIRSPISSSRVRVLMQTGYRASALP